MTPQDRPELGERVRLRIAYSFLSGVSAAMALAAFAQKNIVAGGGISALAIMLIFIATTNRW